MNPATQIKQTMTVYRYPNLSETQPLISRPMISPTLAPFDRPACQRAGTWYEFVEGSKTPYLRLNCGKA